MATLISPYTDLVLSLAGIAGGGVMIATLLGRPRALYTGVLLGVVALLSVLAIPALFRGAAGFEAARNGLHNPDPSVRHEKCFFDRGFEWQLGFMLWTQSRIPDDATYSFDSRTIDRGCFALSLLPRQLVRRTADPQWTIVLRRFDSELRERIESERALPEEQRTVFVLRRDMAVVRNN
jgi:hypothetical protein